MKKLLFAILLVFSVSIISCTEEEVKPIQEITIDYTKGAVDNPEFVNCNPWKFVRFSPQNGGNIWKTTCIDELYNVTEVTGIWPFGHDPND